MDPVFLIIIAYAAAAALLLFWPTREFIRAVRSQRRISLSDLLLVLTCASIALAATAITFRTR
jgi:hypothetical protein